MDKRITVREDGVFELPRARDVRIVREAIAGMPEVRTEKVERLRDMIEAGQYHPDSRVAALNIMRETILDRMTLDHYLDED